MQIESASLTDDQLDLILSIDGIRSHCNLSELDSDAEQLKSYRLAAVAMVEAYSGFNFISRSVSTLLNPADVEQIRRGRFEQGEMDLGRAIIQSVQMITIQPTDGGAVVSFDNPQWVMGGNGKIYPPDNFYDAINNYKPQIIRATFTAGFVGTGDSRLLRMIQAAKMLVAHYYQFREITNERASFEVLQGFRELIRSFAPADMRPRL